MELGKELAKNTLIIAFGKICTQSVSFFLLPVYTALLTTSDYGIVDLFNSYINLLIPIVSLQIDQGVFRYVIKASDKEEQKSVVTNASVFFLIVIFIYGIVFSIVQFFVDNPYKIFLYVSVLVSVFSGILLQLARGLKDNMTYAIGSTIAGIGTVIFNVIFIVFMKLGPLGMFLSGVLANLLTILYLIVRLNYFKYVSIRYYSKLEIKKILAYSTPLVPSSLSWWAIDSSDRTIVSIFLGIAANGILSIAHKIPAVITQSFNIFNIAWVQFVISHFEDKNRDQNFKIIINQIVSLCLSICLLVIAVVPFIFSFIINEKFSDAYYQIPILVVAVLFTIITNVYTSFYISVGNSKKIGYTAVVSGIIDIIIHLLLIKPLGLYAATLSSAIAYGIMMIWRYIDCNKIINAKLSRKLVVSYVTVLCTILIVYYRGMFFIKLMALVIACIYSSFINKKILITVFSLIKQKVGQGDL